MGFALVVVVYSVQFVHHVLKPNPNPHKEFLILFGGEGI
jgi:hypothetical protein